MSTSQSNPYTLPTVPISDTDQAFTIRRIFCVGRNYAEHAAEMGAEVDREAPFYFTKSAFSYSPSGVRIHYPPGTNNLHHEVELVVAIGKPVFRCSLEEAAEAVLAYGCGLDMTRRDLQQVAKDTRRPWDTGKDFEHSAVIGELISSKALGALNGRPISLDVNGEQRQSGNLDDMVWKVDEIIAHLSTLYHLAPGDLIMTGTPAGVGPVVSGDKLIGRIDGLSDVELEILEAE